MKTNASKTKATIISCTASEAQAVRLAGTFNDWNPDSIPMKRTREGKWSARLDLPAGRYEFKFVVDGQWCCEPDCEAEHRGCPKCVPNEHGTMNRVLEVE